jgi:hypothetical protein
MIQGLNRMMQFTKKTTCMGCMALTGDIGSYACKFGKTIDIETAKPKERCFKPKCGIEFCRVDSYEYIEKCEKEKLNK